MFYVHYRIRPSEPEASDQALALQKQAVREFLAEGAEGSKPAVLEFVDTDDDNHPTSWPAFFQAAETGQRLIDEGQNASMIIPSHDGIGRGRCFEEPSYSGKHALLSIILQAPLHPLANEISVPDTSPGPLSLLAICGHNTTSYPVYLCNAGPAPLHEITVAIITNSATGPGAKFDERDKEFDHSHEEQIETLKVGSGVKVDLMTSYTLHDARWYVIKYIGPSGRMYASSRVELDLTGAGCQTPDAYHAWMKIETTSA